MVQFGTGLLTAPNPDDEPFGFERIQALVERYGHEDAEYLAWKIRKAVQEWMGSRPPEEDITLSLMSKVPGLDQDGVRLREVPLQIAMPDAFAEIHRRIAYERLLLDLIKGDQTLFVRRDEVEAQWHWIDAIRAEWEANGVTPKTYTSGTWGPSAAIALTERDGVSWHE